jgi:cation/acetate symporter
MVGTAGLPHVIVRFFTVKKVSDARKSAGWALLFIAILYTTAPAIAVFARTNLIETVSNKPYKQMPPWVENWEKTGLMKFDDKNKDGLVQYLADPELNELTVDKDIMVLANPEIADLPNWVIALVAAGGLAAALSTAAGLLLVISASVSHDLIKKMINPKISEKGELIAARISAVIAVSIAGYFGINPPDIILGIFVKRMNKEGAVAGMVIGMICMLYYMVRFKFGWFGGGTQKDWWFGISPEGFGTVAMMINFIVSLMIALMFPKPPLEIQELVENIRIPSGSGKAHDH